jgi:hypothetical protein
VNLLALFAMTGSMASGIVLSRHAFSFISISGFTAFARALRQLAAYWGFMLMSLHLGLHWSVISGRIRQSAGQKAALNRRRGNSSLQRRLSRFTVREARTY